MIFQTNPLSDFEFCNILKTKTDYSQDPETAGVMVSLEHLGDTSLGLVDSVST
jgi:hypothetical protein